MEIVETIKAHPYMIAGGVAGVLVLVLLMRASGGSSGGAVVVSGGGAQTDPAASQLAMASLQGQVQLGTAQIGAGVASQQIDANIHMSDMAALTAQNIEAIRNKSATDQAALLAQTTQDNIRAQESVALDTNASNLQALRDQNATQLAALRVQTQGTVDMMTIQSNAITMSQAISAEQANHALDVGLARDTTIITTNAQIQADRELTQRTQDQFTYTLQSKSLDVSAEANQLTAGIQQHALDVSDTANARAAMVAENNNLRDNLTEQYHLGLEAALGHPLYG